MESKWKFVTSGNVSNVADEALEGMTVKSIPIEGVISGNKVSAGVIAHVILTRSGDISVIYHDADARTDSYAQEVIQEAMTAIQDKYTIWIVKEDDGTFDVNIWDEYGDERAHNLEVGHLPSYATALLALKQIVKNNPHILFVKLEDKLTGVPQSEVCDISGNGFIKVVPSEIWEVLREYVRDDYNYILIPQHFWDTLSTAEMKKLEDASLTYSWSDPDVSAEIVASRDHYFCVHAELENGDGDE